jgi:hypothetical protein
VGIEIISKLPINLLPYDEKQDRVARKIKENLWFLLLRICNLQLLSVFKIWIVFVLQIVIIESVVSGPGERLLSKRSSSCSSKIIHGPIIQVVPLSLASSTSVLLLYLAIIVSSKRKRNEITITTMPT